MISIKHEKFQPVNDIFLLEVDSPKVKETDYEKSDSGIFIARSSIIDSRDVMGRISKMGPDCSDKYKVGQMIQFYPEAGLDIVFEDKDNKFILIGEEKFLGTIAD